MSEAPEASRYSVRAVERVADILDALRREGDEGASLVQLAAATGLPKSSVFRYLATLESRGYVERDQQGDTFTLGMALPSRASQVELLAARVVPSLERLRDRLGETVSFAVLDGDRVRCAAVSESRRALRAARRPGEHLPLHASALGLAIAATLPRDALMALLARTGMPALTPRTLTRPSDLEAALDRVRDRSVAFEDGEEEAGVRAVAVPLRIGAEIGALGLSAPENRLDASDLGRVGQLLGDEARVIARRLDP